MIRTICLTILALGATSPAFAHTGHAASGFLHPFTGVDHLLAMVGAGMWASMLAARKPSAVWLLPTTFMAMMVIGASAGFAGIKLPLAEAGVLASVFMLGGLVLAAVRVSNVTAMIVVGWFAALHGYAHAAEAPAGDPGAYILGFLGATVLLQGLGLGLGWVAQRIAGDLALRTLGGLVVVSGAFVLVAP